MIRVLPPKESSNKSPNFSLKNATLSTPTTHSQLNHYYHTLYSKSPEDRFIAQTSTIASLQHPIHINNSSNAMSISTCSSNTTKSLSSMASHNNNMSYHRNGNEEYRKSNISTTSTQASSSSTNSRILMSNYFSNDVLDHEFIYNGATGKYEPITLSSSSSSSLNSKTSIITSKNKNNKAIKSYTNEDHLDEIHFRNGKINQCDQYNGNAILLQQQKRSNGQINNTTTNFNNKSIKQTTNINNNTANLTPVLYRKNNSKTNIRSSTIGSSGNNGNNLLSAAAPTTARFTSHNNITNTSTTSSMQSIQTVNHQQHLHSHSQVPPHLVNTLSSPESAYSTGYSTDGTSPGKHINDFIPCSDFFIIFFCFNV